MTDKEKEDNESHITTGGYLKSYEYKEAFKKSWDEADQEDREPIVFSWVANLGYLEPRFRLGFFYTSAGWLVDVLCIAFVASLIRSIAGRVFFFRISDGKEPIARSFLYL